MIPQLILPVLGGVLIAIGICLAAYVAMIRQFILILAVAGKARWNPLAWLLPLAPIAGGACLLARHFEFF